MLDFTSLNIRSQHYLSSVPFRSITGTVAKLGCPEPKDFGLRFPAEADAVAPRKSRNHPAADLLFRQIECCRHPVQLITEVIMAFALTSPAFENGQPIPDEHARDGGNLSPQLDWTDPPEATRSFVMIMDDPDAPEMTFRHWAVFDIPADRRHLAAGRSSGANTESLPHGHNDFGNPHYDGPQPPEGDPPHSYRFRLAALDVPKLEVGEGAYAGDVWEAARHHLLGDAELVGTYASKR